MEISCPQCSSKFNLPEKLAKPGARLRCTVCKTVFSLPGGSEEKQASAGEKLPEDAMLPAMKSRKKSRKLLWIFLILSVLLCGAGAGAWYLMPNSTPVASGEDLAQKVEMLTMRNVRQYNILNEKIGKVFVIEGRVVNEFPEPKELIEVEGAIYDQNKKPVAVKRQLAGTQLSLFQLQVLSEKEMDSFLNNKIELLANNTNVPPGGEVPFMILFYAPPDNITEFGVEIVNVKNAGQPS